MRTVQRVSSTYRNGRRAQQAEELLLGQPRLVVQAVLSEDKILSQIERENGLPEPHAPPRIDLLAHVQAPAYGHGGIEG